MTDCLSEVCPSTVYGRKEVGGRPTHTKKGGETPINNANGGSGAAKVAFYALFVGREIACLSKPEKKRDFLTFSGGAYFVVVFLLRA